MLTPVKAIRAKCLDCCGGQYNEVTLYPCRDCPLYSYRFGKNPNFKLTDEQKARKAANLKNSPTSWARNRIRPPPRVTISLQSLAMKKAPCTSGQTEMQEATHQTTGT